MEFAVSNYRGVASANLDLSTIALVGGVNYAGKTSIAQALAAALTKREIPVAGIQKQHASRLVRDGVDEGAATVSNNGSATSVMWPKCTAEGDGPKSSLYAAGLRFLTDLDAKTMAKELGALIGAEPAKEDLEAYLKARNVTVDIDALWSKIQGLGWDGQHKRAKEIGANLKGRWEQAAGERFGAAKAKSWKPKGWSADMDSVAIVDMEKALAEAKKDLEMAIGKGAVDQGQLDADKKVAESIPQLEAKINEKKAYLQSVEKAELDIANVLKQIPPAAMKCPHCQKLVAAKDNDLVPVQDNAIPAAEREKQVADCSKGLDDTAATKLRTQSEIMALEKELGEAQEAANRAKNLKRMPASEVQAYRDKVDACDSKVQLYRTKQAVDEISANLKLNITIVEALAPEGVRMEKLTKALESFNAALQEIGGAAGWQPTVVTNKLEVTYNGYPTAICSKSEVYRAQTVLQMAIAKIDGSSVIVIDGADILDRRGRNGLFGALMKIQLPSLVCMTIDAREKLPDISKIGGKSYWLADNRTEEING